MEAYKFYHQINRSYSANFDIYFSDEQDYCGGI